MDARVTKDGRRQSLARHSFAVAEWAEMFGARIGFAKLMRLAGLLHDAGKAGSPFQDYLCRIEESYAGHGPMPERRSVVHSTQAAKYIFEKYKGLCPMERLTAEILAMLIASHHDRLPDSLSPDGRTPLRDRLESDRPSLSYKEIISYIENELPDREECARLFEGACQEIGDFVKKINALGTRCFMLHLLIKHLFSCLVDADRFEAYCFEARKELRPQDVASPDWRGLSQKLELHIAELAGGGDINETRMRISDACFDAARYPPGVYQLNVPTGGGKTLSSLRFALNHARENTMSRVIYIIPYLSVIEQAVDTIRPILGDEYIFEHHSNLLPEEKGYDHSLLAERWESELIFTTMAQFMESFFGGSTRRLRKLHHLAHAVLIFDEIQSLPLNCVHLFNDTINYLSHTCDATVLLCTATQPLLDRVLRPLRLSPDADITPKVDLRIFERVRAHDARTPQGYSHEELAAFSLEKLKALSSGLIVLNTRRDAVGLFRALQAANAVLPKEKAYKLYHLSTSMCPAHRLATLKEIKALLGKERLICVSTQLIEAGVDLSFECVIRALAGLDSIVQAFGRCNRNREKDLRDCYIVNVTGERLDGLPDIQCGADESSRILDAIRVNPCAYDGNPLSRAAITRYYETYFYKNGPKMDYDIKNSSAALYDLLSENRLGRCNYRSDRPHAPMLQQAFDTAGRNFCFIEDTKGALVSYGGGADIIAGLADEDTGIERRAALLKEAGQYSVNLFENQIKRLEEKRGLTRLTEGVLALCEGYYDAETGFHMD